MSYKYIHMVVIGFLPKTTIYSVNTNSNNDRIGIIKWYSMWRQYCFFPEADTVWNKECLNDVNEFIQVLMDKRKPTKGGRGGKQ